MIMRHWMDCPIVVTHGRLREWQIFTKRKGEIPNKDTGEVTYDIDCYSRAVVLSGVTTEPITHEGLLEQFFVVNGEGVVIVAGQEKAIRPGSSFVLPSGAAHRIRNTGADDLEFILARRPPCADGSEDGFVIRHWTEERPESQFGAPFQGHWNHIYRGPEAGIHVADLPPRKISHPHNHGPGLDEIWYIRKGNAYHWMGREYQPQTPGCALWLEPEEIHSLMNPSDETVEYIYCSSSALLSSRTPSAPEPAAEPSSREEIINALDAKFSDLVTAYQKTGISVHGIGQNIGEVRKYIKMLKEPR